MGTISGGKRDGVSSGSLGSAGGDNMESLAEVVGIPLDALIPSGHAPWTMTKISSPLRGFGMSDRSAVKTSVALPVRILQCYQAVRYAARVSIFLLRCPQIDACEFRPARADAVLLKRFCTGSGAYTTLKATSTLTRRSVGIGHQVFAVRGVHNAGRLRVQARQDDVKPC